MSLEQLRQSPVYPLKIFYDGSCFVCSSEMYIYMRKDHGGKLEFVDISDPEFDPDAYGISLADFMYQMHAVDLSGRIYRGPEAFAAIWRAFPESSWYRFFAALISLPGMRFIARALYLAFARIRKYLPKRRKAVCKIGKRPPS